MSLSNPNKPVTEQRLSEFYQQILPYLGGMPDILANKFARGDMYSTDEKMIGQWIDGKPLYQKSIPFSTSTVLDTYDITTLPYVEKMISLEGFILDSNNYYNINNYNCRLRFNSSTQVLTWLGAGNWAPFQAVAIVQYTKPADSPVEIGIDTDYSTTEKIVGTWIDGKPLYQKTFVTTTASNSSEKAVYDVTGLNVICISQFRLEWQDGSSKGYIWDSRTNGESTNVDFYTRDNTLYIQAADPSFYGGELIVTLQYTKTTD